MPASPTARLLARKTVRREVEMLAGITGTQGRGTRHLEMHSYLTLELFEYHCHGTSGILDMRETFASNLYHYKSPGIKGSFTSSVAHLPPPMNGWSSHDCAAPDREDPDDVAAAAVLMEEEDDGELLPGRAKGGSDRHQSETPFILACLVRTRVHAHTHTHARTHTNRERKCKLCFSKFGLWTTPCGQQLHYPASGIFFALTSQSISSFPGILPVSTTGINRHAFARC